MKLGGIKKTAVELYGLTVGQPAYILRGQSRRPTQSTVTKITDSGYVLVTLTDGSEVRFSPGGMKTGGVDVAFIVSKEVYEAEAKKVTDPMFRHSVRDDMMRIQAAPMDAALLTQIDMLRKKVADYIAAQQDTSEPDEEGAP